MATGVVAALIAVLALGYVEGLRRFYPARRTWLRLRSRHGRRAIWAMRRRIEHAAAGRIPRTLAVVLIGVVAVWIALAPTLAKRWWELLLDVLPYGFVSLAMLRASGTMRAIADRMRGYEKELGEDPDNAPEDEDEGGANELAL